MPRTPVGGGPVRGPALSGLRGDHRGGDASGAALPTHVRCEHGTRWASAVAPASYSSLRFVSRPTRGSLPKRGP
jgi:hypothetical protein